MNPPSSLEDLIKALRCLPGVGPKSAQRMAYHLLQRDRQGALHLARSLDHAVESVKHCSKCNNFSEDEICVLCRSPRRETDMLCVVEMPADLLMMEQAQCFRGMYFVLMGRLSPLDGMGATGTAAGALAQARAGIVVRGDPGDQLHRRGRGDRTLPCHLASCAGGQGIAHRARLARGR